MKTFSRTRIISLLLCMALLAGLLMGCQTTTPAATTTKAGAATTAAATAATTAVGTTAATTKGMVSDKPVEISMLYRDEGSYPYRADWLIWKEITKRTNVTLKPIVVPASDWDTKVQLLLSTGDAPDYIARQSALPQFVAGNTLVAISDYAAKLPNYMSKFKAWGMDEEVKLTSTYPDGKWYELRSLMEVPWLQFGFAVRSDIVKANNLVIPTDYTQMKAFLQAIKDKTGTATVWTDKWNGKGNNFWGPTWGCQFGAWSTGDWTYYDAASSKWIFNGSSKEYREYLRFMADLVKSGLYDPQTFTISGDQIVAKLTTGEAFFSAANYNEVVEWNEFGAKTVGSNFKFEMIIPPSGPKGDIGVRAAKGEYQIIIPKTSEKKANFDTLLKFIDWCYGTEEASLLFYWGVEGVTYKVVNNAKQPMDDISYIWMNPGKAKDIRKDFGIDNMNFKHYTSTEMFTTRLSPEERAYTKAYLAKLKLAPVFPAVFFTADKQEEFNLLGSSIKEYAAQMYVKFITGESNVESDWDAYVAELAKKGVDKYVDMKNAK